MTSQAVILKNANVGFIYSTRPGVHYFQHLCRKLILQSLGASSLSAGWDTEPVSQITLELFKNNPELGPNVMDAKLDTSGKTLNEMKLSSWNRLLISKLAEKAQILTANDSEQYGCPDLDWENLFRDKINRILRDVYNSRNGNMLVTSVAKKLRSIRVWVGVLCSFLC